MSEPYVFEVVNSSKYITEIVFSQPEAEKRLEDSRDILLTELAKSGAAYKYICMARNKDYHDLSPSTLQPFGTIAEAISYGNQLLKQKSRGEFYYQSFDIQPLLPGKNSFQLTKEQIKIILEIESANATT